MHFSSRVIHKRVISEKNRNNIKKQHTQNTCYCTFYLLVYGFDESAGAKHTIIGLPLVSIDIMTFKFCLQV